MSLSPLSTSSTLLKVTHICTATPRMLGFHSLVDEEQELEDARDANDDEIPVCLHQYVMELKKETHQRLIVGGERRCSILLSP